jgi:hypothetical protein
MTTSAEHAERLSGYIRDDGPRAPVAKCGKHNTHYNTEYHKACPICRPDSESSIDAAIKALAALYPKRWADAFSMEDQSKVDAIARCCNELIPLVAELCAEVDWPNRPLHTVSRDNDERIYERTLEGFVR